MTNVCILCSTLGAHQRDPAPYPGGPRRFVRGSVTNGPGAGFLAQCINDPVWWGEAARRAGTTHFWPIVAAFTTSLLTKAPNCSFEGC